MNRPEWGPVALVLVVWLAAVAVVVGLSTPKPQSLQTIYVRNLSTYVSDAAVRNAMPAFNAAAHGDFMPLWHIDARLVFLGHATAPVGGMTITLVDKGPVKGALAYHELVNGVPDSVVYAGTSQYYGFSWTVALTHELWEQLADIPAGSGAVSAMQDSVGKIWAQEIADPVESDADAYTRPGADGRPVRISDFITQKWFGALTVGPFDFADHIQQPLQIDPGGYAQWWDGWSWNVVSNFRGERDRGFLIGERTT